MKVSYYCQHVLGIGHFNRSMEICRAIAHHHPTTLITGGPAVAIDDPDISVLQLPGLRMDNTFNNLVPCAPGLLLEDVKRARIDTLFRHFRNSEPEVFITELYPFGRKAFSFELEPVLEAIAGGDLAKCHCYCSVRDILVEKITGRDKFEKRAVNRINTFFDGIFVHADPKIITLDETFSRLAEISKPLVYTGFVAPPPPIEINEAATAIRERLALSADQPLIVASIGGGNVGHELLFAVIQAFGLLESRLEAHLQIFCGPYCDEATYQRLQHSCSERLSVERFTGNFPSWLAAADLSVSMAGYNTCMNLIQAGIPALVYPFRQNREQRIRAERLGRKAPIASLTEKDLVPELLVEKMQAQLHLPRHAPNIQLDGAAATARQLNSWSKGSSL